MALGSFSFLPVSARGITWVMPSAYRRHAARDGRWIEPGDADGDREGGPAQQMETR
jgi:hypothetical protein